jgi:hypothetical protein
MKGNHRRIDALKLAAELKAALTHINLAHG